MYFRNFSIKLTSEFNDYGCSEGVSYPVLAITAPRDKLDNTHILIANDTFKLKWVPSEKCEQVDLS